MVKKEIIKRVITFLIAIALMITLPSVSIVAATLDSNLYTTAYISEESVSDAINKKDTKLFISYFISKNADYYRENYTNPDFKYFNPDKYLELYKDVSVSVGGDKAKALEHYLTYGAFEGRSSGTTFDPIIAITVYPELALLSPDEMIEAWTTKARVGIYTDQANMNSYQSSSSEPHSSQKWPISPISYGDSFGFMLYLCGTDLEGNINQMEGTTAVLKLLLGIYGEEKVNITVLAGGTDHWKNEYMNSLLGGRIEGEINKSAIFTVNRVGLEAAVDKLIEANNKYKSLEDILAVVMNAEAAYIEKEAIANALINANTFNLVEGSLGRNKMSDVKTLESLLEVGKTINKSDRYALSLWNHGGGSLEGICFPSDNSGAIQIPDIKRALDNTGFGATISSKPNKLCVLAFDACFMGGTEIAAYLSDNYDIMYGSEETSAGDIDYYGIIKVAGKKISDIDLGYSIAKVIMDDRAYYNLGSHEVISTAAIMEGSKAQASLDKLNDLAKIFNAMVVKDSTTEYMVYRAVKNARLKCEQISSSANYGQSRDYIDMKDFLNLLTQELRIYGLLDSNPTLKNAISDAVKAADEATIANSFNYGDKKVFYDNGKEIVWANKDFWNQIKGFELSGLNIFVPFRYMDGTMQKTYTDYYADSLSMQDYSKFIDSYTNDFLNSEEEVSRIYYLREALFTSKEAGIGEAVTGYAEMLDMELKDTAIGQVLSIKINDYEPGTASVYSSGNSYIDLYETMDTMVMYITRQALAIYATNNVENENNVYVDIIVGSKTISYECLNGLTSSVNIFTDIADSVEMNVVRGKDYSGEYELNGALYDFIMPSDIEGYYSNAKGEMINKLATNPSAECVTAKGTAKVVGIDQPIPVYHLFEKTADGNFLYRGCVEVTTDEHDINVTGDKLETEYITFYHQTVDKSNNKIMYVEEYEWDSENGDKNNIVSLYNTKKYNTTDTTVITIEAKQLENIGTKADNCYLFAISKYYDTYTDDVLSSKDVKASNYDKAPDILEVLEKSNEDSIKVPKEAPRSIEKDIISEKDVQEEHALEENSSEGALSIEKNVDDASTPEEVEVADNINLAEEVNVQEENNYEKEPLVASTESNENTSDETTESIEEDILPEETDILEAA